MKLITIVLILGFSWSLFAEATVLKVAKRVEFTEKMNLADAIETNLKNNLTLSEQQIIGSTLLPVIETETWNVQKWSSFLKSLSDKAGYESIRFQLGKTEFVKVMESNLTDSIKEKLVELVSAKCDCESVVQNVTISIENSNVWEVIKVQLSQNNLTRQLPVSVDLKNTQTGELTTVHASAKLRYFNNVVLVKEQIPMGSVLTSNDVVFEKKEISIGIPYCTNLEEVTGRITKKGIQPGHVLLRTDLEREFQVRSGDVVSIQAISGELIIQTQGKALQSGQLGEVIPVQNLQNQKKIFAKIKGAAEVEVQ